MLQDDRPRFGLWCMRNTFAVLLLPIRLVWSLDFSHVVLELSCISPFVNLGFDRAFIGHFSLHATQLGSCSIFMLQQRCFSMLIDDS
jgi:hypothetical protein